MTVEELKNSSPVLVNRDVWERIKNENENSSIGDTSDKINFTAIHLYYKSINEVEYSLLNNTAKDCCYKISDNLKELDGYLLVVGDLDNIDDYWKEQIENLIKDKDKSNAELDFNNREITTGKNYAYIRVADGCDNFCTFCAIPYIRGRFKSRKEEDILEEVTKLANEGIKEFIIIAQDTTKYGILRLIVSDNKKAIAALEDNGFVVRENEVIIIAVPDEPNGLNSTLAVFDEKGINLEYLYAFVSSKTD